MKEVVKLGHRLCLTRHAITPFADVMLVPNRMFKYRLCLEPDVNAMYTDLQSLLLILTNFHLLLLRLFPFVSIYLYEQGWILGEANKRRSPRPSLFSEMPRAPFGSFALSFCIFC